MNMIKASDLKTAIQAGYKLDAPIVVKRGEELEFGDFLAKACRKAFSYLRVQGRMDGQLAFNDRQGVNYLLNFDMDGTLKNVVINGKPDRIKFKTARDIVRMIFAQEYETKLPPRDDFDIDTFTV